MNKFNEILLAVEAKEEEIKNLFIDYIKTVASTIKYENLFSKGSWVIEIEYLAQTLYVEELTAEGVTLTDIDIDGKVVEELKYEQLEYEEIEAIVNKICDSPEMAMIESYVNNKL